MSQPTDTPTDSNLLPSADRDFEFTDDGDYIQCHICDNDLVEDANDYTCSDCGLTMCQGCMSITCEDEICSDCDNICGHCQCGHRLDIDEKRSCILCDGQMCECCYDNCFSLDDLSIFTKLETDADEPARFCDSCVTKAKNLKNTSPLNKEESGVNCYETDGTVYCDGDTYIYRFWFGKNKFYWDKKRRAWIKKGADIDQICHDFYKAHSKTIRNNYEILENLKTLYQRKPCDIISNTKDEIKN